MTYKVVNTQNWIITNSANQPQQGFLVTVTDDVTQDSFSLETPSVDPVVVVPLIQKHLDNRRNLQSLDF